MCIWCVANVWLVGYLMSTQCLCVCLTCIWCIYHVLCCVSRVCIVFGCCVFYAGQTCIDQQSIYWSTMYWSKARWIGTGGLSSCQELVLCVDVLVMCWCLQVKIIITNQSYSTGEWSLWALQWQHGMAQFGNLWSSFRTCKVSGESSHKTEALTVLNQDWFGLVLSARLGAPCPKHTTSMQDGASTWLTLWLMVIQMSMQLVFIWQWCFRQFWLLEGRLGLCAHQLFSSASVCYQRKWWKPFLAAGDDGYDDGTADAKARTFTHKRHSHKHIRVDFSTCSGRATAQNSKYNSEDEPVVLRMA